MIVFSQSTPPGSIWRRQLVAALPGLIVGIGLAVALRWTSLTPPARVLVSSLPTFFLLTFLSPFAGTTVPAGRSARRAAVYAVVASTVLYGIMLGA